VRKDCSPSRHLISDHVYSGFLIIDERAKDPPEMRKQTLIPHTPIAIALITALLFQIERLIKTMSTHLAVSIFADFAYTRSTIKNEAAARAT
jgi:hypothetical protein